MELRMANQQELEEFGQRLGALLQGGEVIELVGDVGAGKTTLVKAIAKGMGVPGDVSSPSYTLSQVYAAANDLTLVHYDFYRLNEAGILADALDEALQDTRVVTAVEWGGIVSDVLPEDHMRIHITPLSEDGRRLELVSGGEKSGRLLESLV